MAKTTAHIVDSIASDVTNFQSAHPITSILALVAGVVLIAYPRVHMATEWLRRGHRHSHQRVATSEEHAGSEHAHELEHASFVAEEIRGDAAEDSADDASKPK